MGGLVYRVGDYQVIEMDYAYEVPEDGADNAEYYDSLIASITVERVNGRTAKEKSFDVPVSELWHISVDGEGRYHPSWRLGKEDEGKTPKDWLFTKLTTAREKILITPRLNLHLCDSQRYLNSIPGYYLNSEIYDDDITVKTIKRVFQITDLKEIDWLNSRGFCYSWD